MKLFKKCCLCQLNASDIPNIPNWQIYGFTPDTNWQIVPFGSQTLCCVTRNYSAPANAPFEEVFTDTLARSYIKETGRVEVRAMSTRTRFDILCCNLRNPNPVLECDQDVGQAYYVDFENIEETEARAAMRYRIEDINVRIGQHINSCGENEGKRIYTVMVRFTWRVRVHYQLRSGSKRSRTSVAVHPCMTKVLPDLNDDFSTNWGDYTLVFDNWVSADWVQQYETLPEDFTVDSHASPITPAFFDECIELISQCYAGRRPKTPSCVNVFFELEHEVPLLELESRERCEPLGYGQCCYPWNQLVRQDGYTGRFGIFPYFPNNTGTGYGVVFIVPVARTGACCDPCPQNANNFTNNEKAIVFGQHSMVSYSIESEFFETTENYALQLCVPSAVRDFTS